MTLRRKDCKMLIERFEATEHMVTQMIDNPAYDDAVVTFAREVMTLVRGTEHVDLEDDHGEVLYGEAIAVASKAIRDMLITELHHSKYVDAHDKSPAGLDKMWAVR
jgi:hypothetical protein